VKYFNLGVAALVAVAVLSPSAQAQCAAAPTQALVGTWVFSTDGFARLAKYQVVRDSDSSDDNVRGGAYYGFGPQLLASAGNFVASVNSQGRAILQIHASSSWNGSQTRYETDFGSFQVLDDCTGGTLTFNLSSRPVQFEFYFVNPNEITMIANNNQDIVVGTARRVQTPSVCPAIPLQALSGAWVFSTTGYTYNRSLIASNGRFIASVGADRAGQPLGVLALSVTSTLDGSPTRRESDVGRFQINADCSGGTLTFNLSSRPVQFDFWFNSPNSMVMISTTNGDVVLGSARRFGSI
jgi:hypothetical protein